MHSVNELLPLSVLIIAFVSYQLESAKLARSVLEQRFPDSIPEYKVRLDKYNQEINSGHLHKIRHIDSLQAKNSTYSLPEKVSYLKFKEILQCSDNEPGLDGSRGSISLMKMIPPTREGIEKLCAWSESGCLFSECPSSIHKLRNLSENEVKNMGWQTNLNGFSAFIMYRVINGELYYDWPWHEQRILDVRTFLNDKFVPLREPPGLISTVLHSINDMKDVVFFVGGEISTLPYNFPFPLFSNSPPISSADIPFPWNEHVADAVKRYSSAHKTNPPFADLTYDGEYSWDNRTSKAAFFSSYSNIRHILYDQAVMRPDLFDVSLGVGLSHKINSWSPLRKNEYISTRDDPPYSQNMSARIGEGEYIKHLAGKRSYNPKHYKYVAVLLGLGGSATAARLGDLLAHSGSVILLQVNSFEYHFSARLEPWVHYVPITFSTSDIIEKVEWLKMNDDKAKQIARNAHAFGQSYLRLEDLYCYAATAVETLANLMQGTDACAPFSPHKLSNFQ
eukprot:gene13578-18221_t